MKEFQTKGPRKETETQRAWALYWGHPVNQGIPKLRTLIHDCKTAGAASGTEVLSSGGSLYLPPTRHTGSIITTVITVTTIIVTIITTLACKERPLLPVAQIRYPKLREMRRLPRPPRE